MRDFWNDLRLGGRALTRRPAFAITAVLTLALGIGGTTAIFAVVNAVLLRPLPYDNPGQLVQVNSLNLKSSRPFAVTSPANFLDWRTQAREVAQLGGYLADVSVTIRAGGEPERVTGARVSASIFPTLGIRPAAGREFSADDDGPQEMPAVAIVSDAFATRRFGSGAAAVNQTVAIDGQPFTIVGVMPAGFAFPNRTTDVWLPFGLIYTDGGRGNFFVSVVGRLRPGVTIARAESTMRAIAANLAAAYPDANTDLSVALTPLREEMTGRVRPTILLLFVAAGLLLLIATANIAHLLLARGAERGREIALRRALGASRAKLVRQLLAESLLIGGGGGALGLLFAAWGIGALGAMQPGDLPTVGDVSLDVPACLFTIAISIGTGLLVGLVPAWQTSGVSMIESIRAGSGSRVAAGHSRLRWALVAVEVALAMVLLVGSGLLVRSLLNVLRVEPGFRPNGVVTFEIALPWIRYDRVATPRFFTEALDRFAAIPGVRSVGATTMLPLNAENNSRYFTREGRRSDAPRDYTITAHRLVSARYFETLGMFVTQGRGLSAADFDAAAQPVVVVNDAFARTFFAGEDPIGKRMKMGETTASPLPWMTVVGIVADVRHSSLEVEARPEMYRPFTQTAAGETERRMTFVIATSMPIDGVIGAARGAARAIDPDVPIARVDTMDHLVASSLARRRFTLRLVEVFALVALGLAVVGVYGVVSYQVAQDTRSLGIRLALGARTRTIVATVLRPGVKWTGVGLLTGLAIAIGVTRLMTSVLFHTAPADPLTIAGAAGIVAIVAVGACVLPARRATRIDPVISLRGD